MAARIGLEPDGRDVLLQRVQDENAALHAENGRLRAENERLRERDAQREAELERVSAELAVLQRLVFGRSSQRARCNCATLSRWCAFARKRCRRP